MTRTLPELSCEPGTSHLDLLLAEYAAGNNVRTEIATNIVARFRPILKAATGGTNYDGPLYAEIERALRAAEAFGALKVPDGHRKPEARPTVNSGSRQGSLNAKFNDDELQRCLFCKTEYRPAVEKHVCTRESVLGILG